MTIWAQDVILTGLPPAWGHVLKLATSLLNIAWHLVAPPRGGACIETSPSADSDRTFRLPPARGACIETS